MPESAKKPARGYIPTLDGWRAIAVCSVVASHDEIHHLGPFSDYLLHTYGYYGVDLFFAISGILICTRLLEEEDLHHKISVKGFYIRRFCRILPPAYVFLLALLLLKLIGAVPLGWIPWFCSLLFVQNFYFAHVHNSTIASYANHFWSLAVEEHFYLLLPGILVLFPRRRKTVLALLAVAAFAYALIVTANRSWYASFGGSYASLRTDMRIHALLFPALLAILLRQPRFRAFCAKYVWPLWIAPLIWLAWHFMKAHLSDFFFPVVAIGFPFLLIGTILRPASYFSRFLELPPLRFLGRISYSIYLWQQLFFIRQDARWPLPPLQSAPWNYICTFALAIASYYLLEKPFMRLGHRLAPPATPGRTDIGKV